MVECFSVLLKFRDRGLVLLACSSFLSGVLLASVGWRFCTVRPSGVFLFSFLSLPFPWRVLLGFAFRRDSLCDSAVPLHTFVSISFALSPYRPCDMSWVAISFGTIFVCFCPNIHFPYVVLAICSKVPTFWRILAILEDPISLPIKNAYLLLKVNRCFYIGEIGSSKVKLPTDPPPTWVGLYYDVMAFGLDLHRQLTWPAVVIWPALVKGSSIYCQ